MIKKIQSMYRLRSLFDYNASIHARHNFFNVFVKSKKDITPLIKDSLINKKILILGSGYHYSDVILFSNVSNYVVGLDILRTFYRDGFIKTIQSRITHLKESIFKALITTIIYKYRYRKYYKELHKLSKKPIDHNKYNLQSYNGDKMPFTDSFIDISVSNAVIEHITDLDNFCKELYRVTKKNGIAYHLWHNYYSISGAHVPERLYSKYPWGHLRGIYKPQNHLNKLTPQQIKTVFSKYFDIISFYQLDKNNFKKGIDNEFIYEYEKLLSKNIVDELKTYQKETLLTRAYLIIGRRK